MPAIPAPDNLCDWTLPPPAALDSGEVEPIRVFDSAEAAIAFLARHEWRRRTFGTRIGTGRSIMGRD